MRPPAVGGVDSASERAGSRFAFGMTRRSLVRRVLLLLATWASGLPGCASRKLAATGRMSSERAGDGSHSSLAPHERGALVAFAEVVVEGRDLASEQRRYLVQHVDDRASQDDESLALYRQAAATLDRLAGGQFTSLDEGERVALVSRYRLAAPATSAVDGGVSADMNALRLRLVPDLIRAYYGSPAGWAVVEYESFPGRCGDLTRYTRPDA